MSITVTGATGGLGRATLGYLSEFTSSTGPSIVGTTRSLSRAPQIPNATFRVGDFDTPSTLDTAFAGAAKVLIVSTDSFDNEKRLIQHKNAIDACVRAGVGRVYYTSLAINGNRENSVSELQHTHLETEKLLKESGLSYTIIREGVYTEAFPLFLSWTPESKSVILPYDGPIAFASRTELAEGTARLLLSDDEKYVNSTVVLTGPEALTLTQVAEVIRGELGNELVVEKVGLEEYVKGLVERGERPEAFARSWATTLKAFEDGEAGDVHGTLEELLGRQPRGAREVVRGLVKEGLENGGYKWHQNEKVRAAAK
ncbi:NAD(P)-binding protein [Morchella conica CCBAS932]|uniref:NAD(P)-binding protein n=1 Tax=Morchella conica CCBAS932 TaxID=1392247 RepID=A0A3N4L4F9_9PEZI|nr:NAD(P)-binding protein [Morchella conica CCBAS932]